MAVRMTRQLTRRDFAALAGGFLVSTRAFAQTDTPLLTRSIPGSGERIATVGFGTAYIFDENNETTRSKADAVVQVLVKNGGRLIDTASTYGDAESVLGEVTAAAGLRDKLFIATKLASPDSARTQAIVGTTEDCKRRSAAAPQCQEQATISRTFQGMEETRRMPLCRHHFDIPPRLSRDRGRAGTGQARFRPDRLFNR